MYLGVHDISLYFQTRPYLVGGLNPSEKYEFVSWDDEIPNIWKNNPKVPNHHPGIEYIPIYCSLFKAQTKPHPRCPQALREVYSSFWIYIPKIVLLSQRQTDYAIPESVQWKV